MAKLLIDNAGQLTEFPTVAASAGAADNGKIPELNAAGIIPPGFLNAVSASSGAADANKIPLLDANGKLLAGFMPTGVGADTFSVLTSEALAAGDLVNVYNNAGTANVRKADASTTGKEAMGFVLAAFGSGVSALVYFEGNNGQVTGLTGGKQWLSTTTPGKTQATAPTTAGQVSQTVGFATAATNLNFQAGPAILRA